MWLSRYATITALNLNTWVHLVKKNHQTLAISTPQNKNAAYGTYCVFKNSWDKKHFAHTAVIVSQECKSLLVIMFKKIYLNLITIFYRAIDVIVLLIHFARTVVLLCEAVCFLKNPLSLGIFEKLFLYRVIKISHSSFFVQKIETGKNSQTVFYLLILAHMQRNDWSDKNLN